MISPDPLKRATDPVLRTSREVRAFAEKVLHEGKSLVCSVWNRIPLFVSVKARTYRGERLRDETHYFLVPFAPAPGGHAFYSVRHLPEGVGAINELPKLRVFHLPVSGSERMLEEFVVREVMRRGPGDEPDASQPLSERLGHVADEIDRQTNRVTAGLLVLGGAITLANPAVGMGVLAKALWPFVGSKLSSEGLRYVGEKLARLRHRRAEQARRRAAAAELKSAPVEWRINPLLRTLEEALAQSEPGFDPLLHFSLDDFAVEGWSGQQMLRLTAQAISDVYAGVLASPKARAQARLDPPDVRWLETIRTFTV
jgi:hypothetical protein